MAFRIGVPYYLTRKDFNCLPSLFVEELSLDNITDRELKAKSYVLCSVFQGEQKYTLLHCYPGGNTKETPRSTWGIIFDQEKNILAYLGGNKTSKNKFGRWYKELGSLVDVFFCEDLKNEEYDEPYQD